MSDERPGMDYCDVSKRIKRIVSIPGDPQAKGNLIGSLINQATTREGEKAKISLIKESLSFSGSGCKQTGIGNGKRLGDGRWSYQDGKWIQVQ